MERFLFYEGRLDRGQFTPMAPVYLILYGAVVLAWAYFGAALAGEAMARGAGQPLMSDAELGYDGALILALGGIAFLLSGGMSARLRDLGRNPLSQWIYLVAAAVLIGASVSAGLAVDDEWTLASYLTMLLGAVLGIAVLLALFAQALFLPLGGESQSVSSIGGGSGIDGRLIFGAAIVVVAAGSVFWFRPQLQEFWDTRVMTAFRSSTPATSTAPAPPPKIASVPKPAATIHPAPQQAAPDEERPPIAIAPSEPPAPAQAPPSISPPPPETAAPAGSAVAPPKPACAGSTLERLLCSDTALARLNAEVNALYRKARSVAADPGAVKAEQDAWIDSERNACSSAGCLRSALQRRKQELRAWVSDGGE